MKIVKNSIVTVKMNIKSFQFNLCSSFSLPLLSPLSSATGIAISTTHSYRFTNASTLVILKLGAACTAKEQLAIPRYYFTSYCSSLFSPGLKLGLLTRKGAEMQQPGPMFPVTPSFPSTNITTEQIQKYLDENKKLILAILDNQNLGKLAECAQYQAQLQKNLMYLAAIADAQPQTLSPSMPPPMTPHNTMHQGGLYMPHPQAAGMAHQPGTFTQRAPFSTPHPIQDPRHQLPQQVHPQSTQGLMAMWPVGATNGMNPMHNNANLGGVNISSPASNPVNKQDKPESGATLKSDGQGGSAIVRGSADGDKGK